MTTINDAEVEVLVRSISELPGANWPGGYNETALAVIDSIFSVGAHYTSTQNVVNKYRGIRTEADEETARDLLEVLQNYDGPGDVARALNNKQKTSTSKRAILKAAAVEQAARVLLDHGVPDRLSLTERSQAGDLGSIKSDWTKINGQRYGTSWRYFLMLSRLPEVKPDRMISRYCERVLGRSLSRDDIVDVVKRAANRLGATATEIDHRIWKAESGRS